MCWRNGMPKFLGMKPRLTIKRPRSRSASGLSPQPASGVKPADPDTHGGSGRGAANTTQVRSRAPARASSPPAPPAASAAPPPAPPAAPRLLDQLREAIRVRHYSIRTEHAYVDWVRRFVRFHGLQHPLRLGPVQVQDFLTHLAVDRSVASSTQNQAKSALLFLYREVLGVQLPWLDEIVGAKQPQRLPVVLTPSEARALLAELSGTTGLVASLLYGTGLRLIEALRLRVKDVEFERRELIVRDGKGRKCSTAHMRPHVSAGFMLRQL